ncbi:hypothetical protein DY000_02024061 [Brassica cretica]|uniref:Uncharacterized protein n=1 Tax=Brassica cretica TaxID=69181 RepID=A0ABQ7E9B9_BRACR|nr:hypothetical protein DY000_02024061 [Brassica cretica]
MSDYCVLEFCFSPVSSVLVDQFLQKLVQFGAKFLHSLNVSIEIKQLQNWKKVTSISSLGRGVKFVTLTGSSLACHVALPDHGVGLDGQSCSCLIVGWPVGLPSPTLGVGRPSVMFWDENLKVEGVRGQTQTRSEERRDRFRGVGQWYGLDGWEEQDFVGKGLHQYSGKMKIEKGFEESGQG